MIVTIWSWKLTLFVMTLIISDYNGHNGRLVRTAGHLVFIVWITLIKIITPLDTGRGRTGPGPARPRHNCGKSGAIFNRPLPFSRWHAKWGRDKQGDQQCPALCPALISRHTQPPPCRGGWRQRPDLHTSDRTLSTWNIRQHIKQQHTTRHIKHSTSDKPGQLRRVRLTAELRLSAVTPKSCFWHWSRLRGWPGGGANFLVDIHFFPPRHTSL